MSLQPLKKIALAWHRAHATSWETRNEGYVRQGKSSLEPSLAWPAIERQCLESHGSAETRCWAERSDPTLCKKEAQTDYHVQMETRGTSPAHEKGPDGNPTGRRSEVQR